MKKIIMNETQRDTIDFRNVDKYSPIFAKLKGNLAGMLILEDRGWVLKTGGTHSATGYHNSLSGCIESCIPYGYEFFVN